MGAWPFVAAVLGTVAPVGEEKLSIEPVPAWVEEVELALPPPASAEDDGTGMRWLLDDLQVNALLDPTAFHQRLVWTIVDASGLQTGSQIKIEFDPSFQELALHRLAVHRGGEVIDCLTLEEWKLLQREEDLEGQIYDETLTALHFLEDVRVGDVIEVDFTLVGSNPVYAGHFALERYLGSYVRLEHNRCRLLWPLGREINARCSGGAPEARVTRHDDHVEYVWEVRETEPVDLEFDAPAWFNPFPRVQLSDFSSWGELRGWANALFTLEGLAPEVRAKAAEIARATDDPEERVLAALRFVRDEIRYLGIELGRGSYAPTPPDMVLRRRFGDCKDKAQLLGALLGELGIHAEPSLVNASSQRAVSEFLPSPHAFDHAVVRIWLGDRTYWVDPTDAAARGRLAKLYLPDFGWALVLGPHSAGTHAALSPVFANEDVRNELTIAVDFEAATVGAPAKMAVETTYSGRLANFHRDHLDDQPVSDFAEYCLDYYREMYPSIASAGPVAIEDDEAENRLVIRERYEIPGFWTADEESGGHRAEIYAAELDSLLPDFVSPERDVPLAFEIPERTRYTVRAKIGETWAIEPEEETVEDEAFRFRYRSRFEGGVVTLDYELDRKLEHVAPADIRRFVEDTSRAEALLSYQLTSGEDWVKGLAVIAAGLAAGVAFIGLLALVSGVVRWKAGAELSAEVHPFLTGPWFSIWTHPGATLRRALEKDSIADVLVLGALAGVFAFWDNASMRSLGDHASLPAILALGVIGGPVCGLIGIFAVAAVLLWTGKLLGGQGSYRRVLKAVAYARWLAIWAGLLWIPLLLVIGHEMFTTETPSINESSALLGFLIWSAIVGVGLTLWSLVVLVRCLAVAHGFSNGRAFVALIIPGVGLVFLALTCVGLVFLVRA